MTPQVSEILSRFSQVGYKQGNQLLIPLDILIGVEREAVLTHLMAQVIEVSKLLIS